MIFSTCSKSFEAIGRNKKEAEELVAQQALTVLHESKVISSTGKLLCELSTHKTLKSTGDLAVINDGGTPDSTGYSIKKEGISKSVVCHLLFEVV